MVISRRLYCALYAVISCKSEAKRNAIITITTEEKGDFKLPVLTYAYNAFPETIDL